MTKKKLTRPNRGDQKIIDKLRDLLGRNLRQVPEINWRTTGYTVNRAGAVVGLGLWGSIIDNKKLQTLTEALTSLLNLTQLYLRGNQLTDISVLKELPNLTTLDLGNNKLTDISALGSLSNLTMLDLYNNQLRGLPEWITERGMEIYCDSKNHLEGIDLENNPLESPPVEIVKQGREAIRVWFAARKKGKRRTLNEAKVLLVGQGGVGKTSLVKRLIDNDYNPAELKTEGIDIRDWEVAGKRGKGEKTPAIKLNVWDFGGQEIMHATHQFFLTKRSLYILVLDARKGENECNIHYWLKIIQSYGGDSPVLVVTNQCDQDVLELNENRLTKDYSPNIKGFFATSCKTGSGIKQLGAAIENQINALAHVYDVLPESYFDIKQKLEQLAESKNFIDVADYRGLCSEHEVTEEKEQNVLLRYLHDLGNVLNFGDPEDPYQLLDTNILNPEWVTEGVYKILNDKKLKGQKDKGVLRRAKIGAILKDTQMYPKKRHGFIIDMMRKFELCFDFPDGRDERVLIPELLGRNEPNIEWDRGNSLNFEYHYSVLPSGLICRFIVRMHSKVTKHHVYWRSGVLMEIAGNMALVRGDTDEGRVYISVAGAEKTRRDALKVIREELKAIHTTVPRLDVKQKVPLPDVKGVVVDYDHLLKLEEAKQWDYWPEGAKKSYKVKELLEGVDVQDFDVFLCHNSKDKTAVKKIGEELRGRGLRVWLDEWELRPGLPWQRVLEKQIENIKSAAVFVGESGIGPWQKTEIEAFLREFVNRGCPVIPVMFENCEKKPKLPVLLSGMMWVDLRSGLLKDGLDNLVWGITGKKPG